MDLIVKDAAVIGGDGRAAHKDVYIENGIIVKIEDHKYGARDSRLINTIDAEGHYLLPGFIDMNCDVCDPGH